MFLSSCATSKIKTKYDIVPNDKDKSYLRTVDINTISGIGVAGLDLKGRGSQRELAIVKAMEDIAYQLGVKVTSQIILNKNNRDMIDNPEQIIFSMFTINGKVLTAKITGSYYNLKTNQLYIYMLADKNTLDELAR